jgi:hypothetical protein
MSYIMPHARYDEHVAFMADHCARLWVWFHFVVYMPKLMMRRREEEDEQEKDDENDEDDDRG